MSRNTIARIDLGRCPSANVELLTAKVNVDQVRSMSCTSLN